MQLVPGRKIFFLPAVSVPASDALPLPGACLMEWSSV